MISSEVLTPDFNVLYLIGMGHAAVTERGGLDWYAGPAAKLSITEHVANDSHVLSGEKADRAEPLARWHKRCNNGTSAHAALSPCMI